MRRIIESLAPADRRIYWRWVGGMFGLYVVVMITRRRHVHQPRIIAQAARMNRAATVAIERSLAPSHQASMPVRQMSRYD